MRSHSFETLLLLVATLLPFFATTSASLLLPIRDSTDGVRKDGYIITYKPSVNATSAHNNITQQFGSGVVRHRYSGNSFKGLAGTFNASQIAVLQSSPFVQSIERDSIGQVDSLVVENDTNWGLQRISQAGPISNPDDQLNLDYTYLYDSTAGAGVDIYIVDSGINTNHTDFGGRAKWGITYGGYTPDVDGLGHGTHVAGIAAGTRFGVAKKANLIAVRVIDSNGVGYSSDCISGVQWVINQVATTQRPSVINISIKFSANDAVDAIVTAAVSAGIHVVVSAGNSADDASSQSPARAPAVTTVGASDATDSIAFYSNYGPLVDIFAPGSNITSDWITSNTATQVDTGTSMASPFVAGLTAYLIGKNGNQSPASLLSFLQSISPSNILSNIPAGTINQLANNGASIGQNDGSKDVSTTGTTSPITLPTTIGIVLPTTGGVDNPTITAPTEATTTITSFLNNTTVISTTTVAQNTTTATPNGVSSSTKSTVSTLTSSTKTSSTKTSSTKTSSKTTSTARTTTTSARPPVAPACWWWWCPYPSRRI